jgi:hypothetical protein
MAELLAVVGAAASFTQLFDVIVRFSSAIEHFCHSIEDAPSELYRIQAKLALLSVSLSSFQQHLRDLKNDEILPGDLRLSLQIALRHVAEVITDVEHESSITDTVNTATLKRRFKWALSEHRTTGRLLERLRSTEDTLACLLQLLTLFVTQIFYRLLRTNV